jgi:hypothetical protein
LAFPGKIRKSDSGLVVDRSFVVVDRMICLPAFCRFAFLSVVGEVVPQAAMDADV